MRADRYLIGIDGGGTHTRAVVATRDGRVLGRATAGPSGLGLGIDAAWGAITEACARACGAASFTLDWSRVILACGLAGSNHPQWQRRFRQAAPPVAALVVESDAYTTLLGAHGGRAGLVIALGTGSVGAVLRRDGTRHLVGGFGFPSGDEASGAWFGLQALRHAQQALDGRVPCDALARALVDATDARDIDTLVAWQARATQTHYAALAPVVLARREHPLAAELLASAGREVEKMIDALDHEAILPVALSGGLGAAIAPTLAASYRARLVVPGADAAQGALYLAMESAGPVQR